jgi:GAF domain
MEPMPETRETLRRLSLASDVDLEATLARQAERVLEIVPDCVGISIGYLQEGLTFTLVATPEQIAVLDAIQYLHGGPCVESATSGEKVDVRDVDPLDEGAWQRYARAGAARGVASSLSVPIREDGEEGVVIGSVNLYGASGNAFTGHHDQLAALFGAWAPGAVSNADLSFSTRLAAAASPARARERSLLDEAIGVLAESEHLDMASAELRLREAAARAGLTAAQIARAVLEAHTPGRHG